MTVTSSEGDAFEVAKSVICASQLVRAMIDTDGDDEVTNGPNFDF